MSDLKSPAPTEGWIHGLRKAYDAQQAKQDAELADYLSKLPVREAEGTVIEISVQMLIYHLKDMIFSWFCVDNDPPKTLEDYRDCARLVKESAERLHDVDAFKLGIDYILGNPNIDAERFNFGGTPLGDQKLREILSHIREIIWPDAPPIPSAGPVGVKLVSMPLKDWYAERGQHQERTLPEVMISIRRLIYHLGSLTNFFDKEDDIPEELEGYYRFATGARAGAIEQGQGYLEELRLGIEYILGNPELDVEFLLDESIAHDAQDLRELLRYVWEINWPDALPIPPGGPPGVKLVKLLPEDIPETPDGWPEERKIDYTHLLYRDVTEDD